MALGTGLGIIVGLTFPDTSDRAMGRTGLEGSCEVDDKAAFDRHTTPFLGNWDRGGMIAATAFSPAERAAAVAAALASSSTAAMRAFSMEERLIPDVKCCGESGKASLLLTISAGAAG
jgi:hypothetical protein